MEGICHVGFWSFRREFLISFGLIWVMFIVTVEMSSQLLHTSSIDNHSVLCSIRYHILRHYENIL